MNIDEAYKDPKISDEAFEKMAFASDEYLDSEVHWLVALRRMASKTKTYEVKYEKNGRTITTSVEAKSINDARNYIKSEHPDVTIVDLYEI